MATNIICDYCNQNILNNQQRVVFSRDISRSISEEFNRVFYGPAGTVPDVLDFHKTCLTTILEFGKLEPKDES